MSNNTFQIKLFPPEVMGDDGKVSWSLMKAHSKRSYALADQITHAKDVHYDFRQTVVLVDVQGIYLSLVVWMDAHQIPLGDGKLLSRFAAHMLSHTLTLIEKRERQKLDPAALDYEQLYRACYWSEMEKLATITTVNRLKTEVELFFAPSPLEKIAERMRKQMFKARNPKLQEQIDLLAEGVAKFPWGERNYKFYDAFVADIIDWFGVDRIGKGYFNFYVDARGLKNCDEKEVDIRIAIRAMEVALGHEAEALCIVSSDQDFIPLHERCREEGLQTYHADVAKFIEPERIGRNFAKLGEDVIAVSMPPDLPWKIIQEQGQSHSDLGLTGQQHQALWSLHCETYDDPHYPYGRPPQPTLDGL